jgi:hypothetical protein
MMKRREFITVVGGAAAWPFAARGQNVRMARDRLSQRRIVRQIRLPRKHVPPWPERNRLLEGRNVAFEYRSAEGQYDRLPLRSRSPRYRRSRHAAWSPSKGRNYGHSNCVRHRKRPSAARACFQSEPPTLLVQLPSPYEPGRSGWSSPRCKAGCGPREPESPNLAPLLSDLEAAARIVGLEPCRGDQRYDSDPAANQSRARKPVDTMPPNLRLGDDWIDLVSGYSLSSAQAIGGAWGTPLPLPTSFDERYGR